MSFTERKVGGYHCSPKECVEDYGGHCYGAPFRYAEGIKGLSAPEYRQVCAHCGWQYVVPSEPTATWA